MTLQTIDISGFKGGVNRKNKKPFLFLDDVFKNLENAYTWREEVKKREGLQFLGRFERALPNTELSVDVGASPIWTFNIFAAAVPPITEPYAEIDMISVEINGNAIKFGDQGNGILLSLTPGYSGQVNYVTGDVTLIIPDPLVVGTDAFAQINYFPSLPAMGIPTRELAGINDEQTLFFDQTYCYVNVGGNFQEFIPGTTWDGSNSNFCWGTN